MGEKAELQRDYSAKESELNMCVSNLSGLEEQISRLKELKREFVTLKSDANELKRNLVMESLQHHDYCKGQLFGEYNNLLTSNLVNEGMITYVKNIDTNLDALNNELMRLENEVYRTEGIIGSIKASLNWITTKLENLVN